MEIRIQANKVQKVSVRSKYDDDKSELTTTIQADLQLHPSDIARITNLLVQKVPLYLVLGSLQAQFDLQMVKMEPPRVPEPTPPPVEEFTRVVMLSEDAVLHTNPDGSKDFLSLRYDGLYLGPFAEICPPVDRLTTGTPVKLFLDRPGGMVIKVELAEPQDIANQHFAEQIEKTTAELEQALFATDERANLETAKPVDNGSKPKRRARKAKTPVGLGFNTGDDK